ncbi:hypothetical protein [Campylobacter concisus]|uniref:hypothetical protein n=1 Tax=Campylobacter concisus TaxID=199 RepID=UPI000D2FCBDB|nr:hypothetical protein [Campylobacter concisus]
MTKGQMRGYLYEIFISYWLQQNGFAKCGKGCPGILNGNIVSEDGEIEGRGTNHQIDFVGIYSRNIPFVFPIRLLAECKFWDKKVDKSFIREYIGVYKDISENYISSQKDNKYRFLDVPVIFSASDFDKEAVNLAWAQCINIVSHSRLPILNNMLQTINNIVDAVVTDQGAYDFNRIKTCIQGCLKQHKSCIDEYNKLFKDCFYHNSVLEIPKINTFLFATNNEGALINLISKDKFPDELFFETNVADCRIYFDNDSFDGNNERVFYIVLNSDNMKRKFYFQANETLMSKIFPRLSLEIRRYEKMKFISKLSIVKKIKKLTRIIELKVNFESGD